MIHLTRVRTEQAIHRHFRGEDQLEFRLRLLDGHRTGTLSFKSPNDRWKRAKTQLKRESFGKCAYCEAPVDEVAHGDVEHYRPKSVYWWLAYCYDNYLFACQICNQSFKSDNFPVAGVPLGIVPPLPEPFPDDLTPEQLRAIATTLAPDPVGDNGALQEFLDASLAELAGLPDPYAIDPEPLFAWTANEDLEEVSIAPRNPNDPENIRVFQAVDAHLGLNREQLRQLRWEIYAPLEVFALTLEEDGISAALRKRIKRAIARMTADKASFAGMARYFVNVEWQLDLTP